MVLAWLLRYPLPPTERPGSPHVRRGQHSRSVRGAFTTCPLPQPQNWLAVRIPAGELTYHSAGGGKQRLDASPSTLLKVRFLGRRRSDPNRPGGTSMVRAFFVRVSSAYRPSFARL